MLMTGRYAMTPGKVTRGIEADREPHLGTMFSKAGYKTGIFGKSQPLVTQLVHTDATYEETQEQYRKRTEWRLRNFSDPELMGLGGRHPGDEINLFWDIGNYTIRNNEVEAHNFDYSFITGKFVFINPCGLSDQ
jgi:arylsulfatase A